MEDVLILQLKKHSYKILDSLEILTFEDKEIFFNFIKQTSKKFLLIVVPFSISKTYVLNLIEKIFSCSEIQGVSVFYNSTLCTFSFETQDIFYIKVEQEQLASDNLKEVESEIEFEENKKEEILKNKITCSVEVVSKMKPREQYSQTLTGDFIEVVHDIFSFLSRLPENSHLASCLYVDSEDTTLTKLFEEKLAMDVCVTDKYGRNQIKYLKFLRIPSYVKEAPLLPEAINDDPVFIGAWLAAKVKFYETLDFTKKEDFLGKNYKDLFLN